MGASTSLRAAFKARFLPFAEREGSAIARSGQPKFTAFERARGDAVHTFDIQWEKHGKPRFVVNCGKASLTGGSIEDRARVMAEITDSGAEITARLRPGRGRGIGSWFRLDVPLLKCLVEFRSRYAHEEVVDASIRLFPEIEAWWATDAVGPHMHLPAPFPRQT